MISRRSLIASLSSLSAAALAPGCRSSMPPLPKDPATALDDSIRAILSRYPRTPGLAAAIVRGDDIIWEGGFGYADLEAGTRMTPSTIMNVGSVTKTVTATAVLQLVEQGQLDLGRDVNDYLGFPLRNPAFPDTPISVRDLLVHRSSILDDHRYAESYVCGDQPQPMGLWLAGYFDEGASPFHPWAPGTKNPPTEPRPYSNVGYGVLGHLVEIVTDMPYHRYFADHIFGPLGMESTGFLLSEIDRDRHAVPYSSRSYIEDDLEDTPFEGADPSTILPRSEEPDRDLIENDQFPHCLYSFGTPTDGLMRTSVHDLSRFLSLYIGRGETQGKRLLARPSIETAFPRPGAALTWWDYEGSLPGGAIWAFSGGDPGITSLIALQPEQELGFAIMRNYSDDDEGEIIKEIFFTLLEASSEL